MTNKIELYSYIDGTKLEIELPLTDYADIESMRKDLGIPSYVNTSYFPIQRAIVTLWAARNVHRLHEIYPDKIKKKIFKDSLNIALFGGGAVKFHSKSANNIRFLNRKIKDVDILFFKKHGYHFYKLLLIMGDLFGTKYLHFVTPSDKRFNAFRHGDRYRIRAFDEISGDRPVIGVMDLIANTIVMRHEIKCEDELKKPDKHLYTIGLENIILSKIQYIMDFDKKYLDKLIELGEDFRIINYPYYSNDKIIIGMELKDMKDVFSILLDHEISMEGSTEEISLKRFVKKLKKDKRLALTARLNLEMFSTAIDHIFDREIGSAKIDLVKDKIRELLKKMPEANKKWNKPWWNISVETPEVQL